MAEPYDRNAFPEATVDRRKSRWASLIWVVPIVAIGIGAWLAAHGLLRIGTTVTVTFKSGDGIEAGRTRVKYKDIDIGVVKSVGLTPQRDVVVRAEITREARDLLVEDTNFWVVRPRITGGQALGLGTLIAGPHIALDPGKSAVSRSDFTGLDYPPPITADAPGRQFVLRAPDLGSVDIGSPVYFRRVRVGRAISTEIDPDGKQVVIRVFVNEPYDKYVTTATRFWDVSGVDVALDAAGVRLQAESLISILIGGVAFEVPPDAKPGVPAENEAQFTLFSNRDAAMKENYTIKDTYVLRFDNSVRGLVVGSPVSMMGVDVGEVSSIKLDYDRKRGSIRPEVEINVYPERISRQLRDRSEPDEPGRRAQALQRSVDRGLRAQLRTGNFVTGQVYVALDFFPNERKVKVDAARTPLEIPTLPGGFEELQASLTSLAKKLEKVPFNEVAADVRKAVNSLDATLREVNALVARVDKEIAPELRATLEQARATLGKAQAVLAEDAPLRGDLHTTLREVERAARSVRELTDYLERHPESLLRGKREESP